MRIWTGISIVCALAMLLQAWNLHVQTQHLRQRVADLHRTIAIVNAAQAAQRVPVETPRIVESGPRILVAYWNTPPGFETNASGGISGSSEVKEVRGAGRRPSPPEQP